MVTQVSSINGYNNNGITPPLNLNANKNLMPNINFSTNNYDNDIMLPSFLKTDTTSFTSTTNEQEPIIQTSIGNNPINTSEIPQATENDPIAEGLKGALAEPTGNIALTENGNPYKKTNFWKKALATTGFLIPIAGRVNKLAKGGKFKELFKFKPLAIACPAIALAGFAIGALADACTNSKRAKAADEAALAQTQNPMTEQLNALA